MKPKVVSDAKSIHSALPSLEEDDLPLSLRQKFLHSPTLQIDAPFTCMPSLVKTENHDSDPQVTCPIHETDASRVEKTSANASILARCSTLSAFDSRVTIKAENCEISSSAVDQGREACIQSDSPTPKVKKEIPEGDVDDLDHILLKERLRMLLTRKLPGLPNTAFEGINGCLLETIMEQPVKIENEEITSADGKTTVARDQCDDIPEGSSTSQIFVKVKDELWGSSENLNVNKDAAVSISIELPNAKGEWEVHDENHDDQVEHMTLSDRLNFLMAGADSSFNISSSYSSLKTKLSSSISSSTFSKSAEPSTTKCRRKRKKTATDSVQEALEEDAPGLLQVLLEKGVLIDEIKLYGEIEDDESPEESCSQDSFSELEAVITKIFPQRHSYFKLPITRASKASRAIYCLACLMSLVEQTQYLKIRKWPVEWGWCRELQSFIFVFKRHNRIVLERPEYGYATYFFELVESLPIEWQIKRLVIAMKLTACSRISILEDKELLVGRDLSEEEAKVLTEYGWTPNTGLGTMLNYRDRVVHDRKNDDSSSEWQSKIGRLLISGYNMGNIVIPDIPKKVAEYMGVQNPDSESDPDIPKKFAEYMGAESPNSDPDISF